jgi:hypothetical protein
MCYSFESRAGGKGARMISLQVANKGLFMSKLLASDAFDSYLMEEAVIKMAAVFSIDGHLNKDFFESAVWDDPAQRPYDFVRWQDVRKYCFEIIKGKTAPSFLRITLRLVPEKAEEVFSDLEANVKSNIEAPAILVRLDRENLKVLTTVEYKTFSLDRSAEPVWDKYVRSFLDGLGITYTEE